MLKIFYTILLLTTTATCIAQEQESKLLTKLTNSISNLDTKLIDELDKQYKKTEDRLTKQTGKWSPKHLSLGSAMNFNKRKHLRIFKQTN